NGGTEIRRHCVPCRTVRQQQPSHADEFQDRNTQLGRNSPAPLGHGRSLTCDTTNMRLGLGLPQFGPFADPTGVGTVAAAAQQLGFDGLWVGERLHAPTEPLSSYPGGDGRMPELFRSGLDPLVTLTLAAQATDGMRLGSSTIGAPLHAPMVLAQQLAGIDQLSRGQQDIGLGMSWSQDEYCGAGVTWRQRGAGLDETLDVLETLFGPDPVEHSGQRWQVPPGQFQPKPVQRRPPPIYLGGYSETAFRRVAARADGWLGVALPVEQLGRTIDTIGKYAVETGRDPDTLATIVRINPAEPVTAD